LGFVNLPIWFEAFLCSLHKFIGYLFSLIFSRKIEKILRENLLNVNTATNLGKLKLIFGSVLVYESNENFCGSAKKTSLTLDSQNVRKFNPQKLKKFFWFFSIRFFFPSFDS